GRAGQDDACRGGEVRGARHEGDLRQMEEAGKDLACARGPGHRAPAQAPCQGGPTGNPSGAADTREVMGELTDAALWQRAAAGETQAFGTIFERHARTVYNYCFRRTGDWSQAEELTAIVFLEAWRRRGQVVLERDEAIPWLLGVATNVLRNLRRSQRRHRAALERLP